MSNNVIEINKEKESMDAIVDSFHNEDAQSPEELTDELSVEMIRRGIKGGLGMLEKAMEGWGERDKNWQADGNSEITEMMNSVQKVLENMDKFMEMIQHDTVGVIKSMESSIAGQWTTQAHLQTLIETLKSNAVVTDEELEHTWNKLIPSLMKDMQSQS